jgi:hypothetical protein
LALSAVLDPQPANLHQIFEVWQLQKLAKEI